MGENSICIECNEVFMQDTDLQLCSECMDLFDTEELWKLHDKNKLDALDFNTSSEMRDKFRKKPLT